MKAKRMGSLLIVGCCLGAVPWAQAQAKEGEEASPRKRHFGLYLQAMTGSVDVEDLNSSISTRFTEVSRSFFDIDDAALGRIGIGWALPEGKGRFFLRYESYKEEHYTFHGEGWLAEFFNELDGRLDVLASEPLRWWTYDAQSGSFVSSRTVPLWDPTVDDADGDGFADPDEVRYPSDPDVTLSGAAPRNLQNRVQVLDAGFEREFGGLRFRGQWMGGLRYFKYEGHVPAGAWLQLNSDGGGFTSGGLLRPLVFKQDTSGAGTAMGLSLQERFFRDRLVFYQGARAAFVLESARADTNEFVILTANGSETVPVGADLTSKTDKSAWHAALEVGVRIQLVEGLHLHLAFLRAAFQDAVLLPESIAVPETTFEARLTRVSGVFKTQDIRVGGWLGGLTFQF